MLKLLFLLPFAQFNHQANRIINNFIPRLSHLSYCFLYLLIDSKMNSNSHHCIPTKNIRCYLHPRYLWKIICIFLKAERHWGDFLLLRRNYLIGLGSWVRSFGLSGSLKYLEAVAQEIRMRVDSNKEDIAHFALWFAFCIYCTSF